MVGNSDESGWRRPPARRGISWSPPQRPHPVASFRTVGGGFWYRISLPYIEACFLHRVPLKTRRVPEEAFLSTARIFGTREGPLRYRMPTTQPPSHHSTPSTPVPNATKARNGKGIACREFIKLPEKRRPLQKRSPECRPSHSLRKTPGITLSPTRKPQMSSLPQKCSGHHP